MTDLTRGPRPRRGGRRPGWLLLTVLLVLAIAASSALVFTDRVELLKLAVILSLWAAAVAAFVSVIYRRQSDVDQARARDLKLVYDLQLDREISARREYELEVESQLRRELATEVRSQAADEVAALRAELAALRANLEIMFDTDLSDRPAIEPERTTVRAYSDWQRDTDLRRRGDAPFVASAPPDNEPAEDAIIDVPEEPAVPVESVRVEDPRQPIFETVPPPPPIWTPPQSAPAPAPGGGRHGTAVGGTDRQPVAAEALWVPPTAPTNGSRDDHTIVMSPTREEPPAAPSPGAGWPPTNGSSGPHPAPPPPAAPPPAPDESLRGRHYGPVDNGGTAAGPPPPRHSGESNSFAAPPPAPTEPSAKHGTSDTNGQSVAELLARLQPSPSGSGGGRRRRRDG